MKKYPVILALLFMITTMISGCLFDEQCETEAQSIKIGQVYIDKYEASRVNATAETQGTGISLACNYAQTLPWTSVTYEDAKNACLDAGKRLCTKEEWMSACGTAYPYGSSHQAGTCNDSTSDEGSVLPAGSKSGCKSSAGVFDMSGNVREWVEEGLLMGGSYNSDKNDSKCSAFMQVNINSYVPTPGDGFRCCQDVSLQPQ